MTPEVRKVQLWKHEPDFWNICWLWDAKQEANSRSKNIAKRKSFDGEIKDWSPEITKENEFWKKKILAFRLFDAVSKNWDKMFNKNEQVQIYVRIKIIKDQMENTDKYI